MGNGQARPRDSSDTHAESHALAERAKARLKPDDYGSKEWFAKLVEVAESPHRRERSSTIGLTPEASEELDRREKDIAAKMYEQAWELAGELLRSGAAPDEKTAIMMAAKALYAKWYNAPPSPQGEARSTNPATLDQQKYAHYRAQQMLWDQSPWYNFAENILLPASVNPNPANLDNLAMAAAPFAAASAALNEKAPQAVPQTPGGETLKPSVAGGFQSTGRPPIVRPAAGPSSSIPDSYVVRKYKISMADAPASSGTNAAGYPRNSRWFWRQSLKQHRRFLATRTKRRFVMAVVL